MKWYLGRYRDRKSERGNRAARLSTLVALYCCLFDAEWATVLSALSNRFRHERWLRLRPSFRLVTGENEDFGGNLRLSGFSRDRSCLKIESQIRNGGGRSTGKKSHTRVIGAPNLDIFAGSRKVHFHRHCFHFRTCFTTDSPCRDNMRRTLFFI